MSSSPLLGPLPTGASLTQLPPSPDLKSSGLGPSAPDFKLGGEESAGGSSTSIRRLRSVARYQAFSPTTLACSTALSAYDDGSGVRGGGGVGGTTSSSSALRTNETIPSCLGAVAGPQGVALFPLSRPHVPLLILSHATKASSSNSISSLAFEPKTGRKNGMSSSMFLAATRGAGVLIWDASGHSPNPLVGRVGMEQVHSGGDLQIDDTKLTSMCWKPDPCSALLATTTFNSVALWDLRTSTFPFKPNIKFGTSRKTSGPIALAPLVQLACSTDSDEVATIDAAGIVQVYDVRMNRGRSLGALSTFAAHETAGVGISYFGAGGGSRWLTWGLDEPMSSAIVKIWTKTPTPPTTGNEDSVDTAPTNLRPTKPVFGSTNDYVLNAQCIRPNLACARVCMEPVENKFLAIGQISSENTQGGTDGWWAELYTLTESENMDASMHLGDQLSIRSFGVQRLAGFQGGNSTANVDRGTMLSALGSRTRLGALQAAELSFAANSVRDKGSEDRDLDLVLCCLSDTGILSTHVLPEAFPKITPPPTHESSNNKESPKKMSTALRNSLVRTAFHPTNQTRVYPDDREGYSLTDAASLWGASKAVADSSHGLSRLDDRRLPSGEQSGPSPQKTDNGDSIVNRRIVVEGGIMPFDMDVPVAYGSVTAGNTSGLQVGMTEIPSGTIGSSNTLGGIIEEGDPASIDPMQKTSVMQNIETERVPCPRLCGAVFGRGNGGLVTFHNGEVKKMWNWFQRADNLRLNNAKNNLMASEQHIRRVHNATGAGSTHPLAAQDDETAKHQAVIKLAPRTLKELLGMMAAAKEAQWGEDYTSDGSASGDALNVDDNFFEDESLGSNSSDDDDDDIGTPPAAEELYQRYFGNQPGKGSNAVEPSWVSADSSHSRAPDSPSPPTRIKKVRPFLGPTSDMLAPVVSLTRQYDREVLSHQSIAIAEGWELGPWDTITNDDTDQYALAIRLEESKVDPSGTLDAFSQKGLPHYRYLSNASSGASAGFPSLVRTKSDGNLEKKYKPNYDANTTISPSTGESLRRMMKESGFQVSGSGVRPNMEESMKFLKKLFTQPHEGGTTGYSTVFSPPDRPYHMLGGHLPKDRRNASTGTIQQFQMEDSVVPPLPILDPNSRRSEKLGVYTLRLPKLFPEDSKTKNLNEIKRICLHNASVCADLGEVEKEGVWTLLADTIERQVNEAEKQLYNGWGGNGGGALGVELVQNLLKYYEARGDFQMLATMACVLSGGRRSRLRHPAQLRGGDDRPYLLPPGQDAKYDMYIRKYADLLYEWGLLSLRAELNKHLVRVPLVDWSSGDAYSPKVEASSKVMGSIEENTNAEGRLPGIAVVFQCPKCGEETEFNSNVCRTCRDFAFRCSLCDNAVQGLFTVCDSCGHGGHVEHMTSWFAGNTECPTGCGCVCTFIPLSSENKGYKAGEGSAVTGRAALQAV